MQPEVVAVVVLRALRDVAVLQVGEPQLGQVTERAAQSQHSALTEARSPQEPILEFGSGTVAGCARHRDVAQQPIDIAVPRPSHVGVARFRLTEMAL
jgi:hypothetical protein